MADGEPVLDVPAKLAARVRSFDTGHDRKTDAHDAHAVAVVAVGILRVTRTTLNATHSATLQARG